MISFPNSKWLEELKSSYGQSQELAVEITSVSQGLSCKGDTDFSKVCY